MTHGVIDGPIDGPTEFVRSEIKQGAGSRGEATLLCFEARLTPRASAAEAHRPAKGVHFNWSPG
jgi:hypothetical protein